MAQQTPYIGSKISLISKLDIRYEGILYTVDSKESTIALSKVRSFGTEDRNAAHVVPPQDEVYDYIIFKANDIKDLIVCETPKPPAPGLPYDPAILSVSQGDKPPPAVAAAPVGSEKPASSTAARRTSTPRNRPPSQSQTQQSQEPQNHKNNDSNKPNNSAYRQGSSGAGYQQRNNYQNRQHGGGYDNNRRGDNKQQQNRNYQPQNRNHYNNYNRGGGNRGNGSNNRSGPRNNLKFDNDYDFEKAYEQFKETLEAIVGDVQNLKVDDSHSNDAGSVKSGEGNETFYDKTKSFFDNISCEALEKEEGMNTRPDWRKERLTNQETFGQQSVRSFGYRGRGGYNRGRFNNYNGQNRNHYNNSNRGGGNGGNRGNGSNNRSGQRNNLNS